MRYIFLVLFLAVTAFGSPPSFAQQKQPAETQQSFQNKLQLFRALILDEGIQKWAREQQAQETGAVQAPHLDLPGFIQQSVRDTRAKIVGLVAALDNIPSEFDRAMALLAADSTTLQLVLSAAFIPFFFFLGLFAEEALWRLTKPIYWRVIDVPRSHPVERLGALLFRLLYAFLSVGVFALFSLGIFDLIPWPDVAHIVVVIYLTTFIFLRLTVRITKIVFSPKAPQLRLLPIDDVSARFFRRWMCIVIGLGVLFATTGEVLLDIGFSRETQTWFTLATSLVIVMLAGFVTIRGRDLLRAHNPLLQGRMLDLWPVLLVVTYGLSWMFYLGGLGARSATLTIVALVPIILRSVEAIIEKAVKTPPERPDSETVPAALQQQDAREAQRPVGAAALIIERAVRAVIIALIAIWVAGLWGLDIVRMITEGAKDQPFAAALFNIVVTLLLGDLVWHAIAAGIDSHLRVSDFNEPQDMSRSEARLQTLLPILRLFLLVVVIVTTLLICLSAIGVNIAPILAGAGVLGIGIGLGAQNLVKDIISGIFFLLDDAFRVGEYIEFGNIRGTVEATTLRSLRLRHHRGQLHTVPFGDVKAITNYSRDWVIEKLELGLTYDTDLELVRKTIKEIGRQMMADPDIAPHIIEPLKSQGINKLGDFALKVRVKFKARATQQFVIRRKAYKLIQEIFPQRGIKFAYPTVNVMGAKPDEPEQAAPAALTLATSGESGAKA
ncbi:MAG TPA: mechanosensitive ion channel family protein [Dongiaceae bacterium]|jgi:small-conductance mechanosensitive channel|nr:mechanosensitive ion channel family protein [Dongiaceae bacterium]